MSLFELNGKYAFKSEKARKAFSLGSDVNFDFSEQLKNKVFEISYISEEDEILQIKDAETGECISCTHARYLLDDEDFEYFEKI